MNNCMSDVQALSMLTAPQVIVFGICFCVFIMCIVSLTLSKWPWE